MAQTKRKRRTKHRGNAAGTIETRGRTGRRPTAEERKKQARATTREQRMYKPPTWRSSIQKAGLAAVLILIFVAITSKGHKLAPALIFAAFAMAFYIPATYYLDRTLYLRRIKKRDEAAAAAARDRGKKR
jgi:hypothetical protein